MPFVEIDRTDSLKLVWGKKQGTTRPGGPDRGTGHESPWPERITEITMSQLGSALEQFRVRTP